MIGPGLRIGLLVTLIGCGGPAAAPRDPDGIPLHGQNVTLYYDPGQQPCAGTLPYLDASVAAIGSYLALPVKAPIPYYFTQELPACPSLNDAGCAVLYDGVVSCWSTSPASIHELVHAVQIDQTGDDTPSFLLEGEAVALGQRDYPGPPDDQGASDTALLSADQIDRADYPLAGDFVSYLLTRFGAAPFERTIAALLAGATVAEVETAFALNYGGEAMAQLRADRATSTDLFYDNRIDLSECLAAAPDERLGQPGTVSETVDCASNARGSPTGQVTRDLPFDITSDGLYRLTVTAPPGGVVTLEACGGSRALALSDFLQPDSLLVGYLRSGRYAFVLNAPGSTPSSFSLGVEPVLLAVDPACASIPPLEVAADTSNIYLFSMDDRTVEVPFVLAETATLTGEVLAASSATMLCTGGCALQCQPSQPLVASAPLAAGAVFSLQATFVGQSNLIGAYLQ